jgi:hypothetical protein
VSLPEEIIATYIVVYNTEGLPEDVDIDTAIDMVKTDLADTYSTTEYDRWYLTDKDGKPLSAIPKE